MSGVHCVRCHREITDPPASPDPLCQDCGDALENDPFGTLSDHAKQRSWRYGGGRETSDAAATRAAIEQIRQSDKYGYE